MTMIVPRVRGTSEWSEGDRSGKFIYEKTWLHLFPSDDSQMLSNTDDPWHCAEQWKTLLHSEVWICMLFALSTPRLHLHSSLAFYCTQYTVDTPAGRACRKMPGNPGWSSGRIFRAVVTSSALLSQAHLTSQRSTLVFARNSCQLIKFAANCECWILSGDSREQIEITEKKSKQLACYRSFSLTHLLLPVKRNSICW